MTLYDTKDTASEKCGGLKAIVSKHFPIIIKGSVSRVLRWVLLYIIQKLFSRPILTSHKIFTFLKGQFTITKNQAGATLNYDMVYGCFGNIEIHNSPSERYDITEKYLYTILLVFLLVYEFILHK